MAPERAARTDKERLATIETELGHLKESIDEVYRYLREEFAILVSKQVEDLRARLKETDDRLGGKASCNEVADVEARIADIERRLRSLEKKIWQALGAMALLAFAGPLLLKLLKVY